MVDGKAYFGGKKITVFGLGLLGRGVGDTAYLADCGADIIVTDMKNEEQLAESLEKLKAYPNITYSLGGHSEADFRGRDMVLVAAGVPSDSPFITIARESGTELAMSGALFAKLSGIPIIGVTGTRGKSTVTHMIHHVLSTMTEGISQAGGVLLGGNVRGVSNLQLIREVHEDSIAVMELDSWQLQGFGWAGISPHIAVFTNFMEDHLNYYVKRDPSTTTSPSEVEYRAGMDAYFADKANIFLNQEESGVFVTTPDVFERAKTFARGKGITLGQEVMLVDDSVLPEDCILKMPGEHNRLNAALALEALRATGITDEEIFEGFATFPGVPGRLEYLGSVEGVKVYNDNNATTPTATVRGIEAVANPLEGEKNVILIAGGAYKEVDPSVLIAPIEKYCKQVVFLPGTGTDKLIEKLRNLPFEWKVSEGATGREVLENAVKAGLGEAQPGDVLLFSPGFASFGMFVNEYDRNDQFVKIIQSKIHEIE